MQNKLTEMVKRIIREEKSKMRLKEDDYWGPKGEDQEFDLEELEDLVKKFVDNEIGLESASGYTKDNGDKIVVSFKHPVESWAEDNENMMNDLIDILDRNGFPGYREGNSSKNLFWLTKD